MSASQTRCLFLNVLDYGEKNIQKSKTLLFEDIES